MANVPSVLIVDNAVHRLLFKPSWHWKPYMRGINTRTVNLPSGASIGSLDRITHLLLTGSETTILKPQPWFEREAALIREAVRRDISILGSCFGHQMLVYALSGPDYLRRSAPPEVGWAHIEMTNSDPLFEGLPNPWSTFVYHFDEVVDPPEPWRTLGRTKHCPTHLLRYGDQPIWGIQPHPEISSGKSRFFLCATLLLGGKSARHIGHALRNVPPRNNVAERIVRQFLEH